MAVPAGPDGSGYHRLYQPFKHLRLHSRHLILIPPPGQNPPPPAREDLEEVDVFIAQRPAGASGRQMWDRIAGACARVYEIDDDLLHVDPSGLPALCDERVASSVRYLLASSEMVTVSTPYLAEQYSAFNRNVVVLPNCVDARLLNHQRPRREAVTVGYQGGQSHLADMCAVQEPLTRFFEGHRDVDMHFIGPDWSPMIRHDSLWTGWAEDIWEYYNAVDFDIAIAPLADIPFNYSKSFLKALDAAALGIPVVATDLPPYSGFVRDGETGFLVPPGRPDLWVRRLHELASDEAMRAEMGAKAREVAAQYTIQGNWKLWESAYERAAGG